MRQIKVIGAGGIGTKLLDPLCQFLNYYVPQPDPTATENEINDSRFELTIVDGDTFEQRNRERQDFYNFGNKAEVKAAELMRKYDMVNIRAIPEYINNGNINQLIQEDDIVLVCVDNHDTRAMIDRKVATIQNVVLI